MHFDKIQNKILSLKQAENRVKQWQSKDYVVVFTNGCFDILHFGHIHYLAQARDLGHKLVVGLNSAASVKRLKGARRPINDEATRQALLASLSMIDAVVVFEEDTPYNLIKTLMPNILVKGGDWLPEQIVGSDVVLANGGMVRSLPFIDGYSTTNIEAKILKGK
jgi:D-glycero-beta-D-manno-heptose 1-phosphate adenylyltransferase